MSLHFHQILCLALIFSTPFLVSSQDPFLLQLINACNDRITSLNQTVSSNTAVITIVSQQLAALQAQEASDFNYLQSYIAAVAANVSDIYTIVSGNYAAITALTGQVAGIEAQLPAIAASIGTLENYNKLWQANFRVVNKTFAELRRKQMPLLPPRMADDREVLREIWDSKIPISFSLAQEEVYTLNPPEPYYLMVPRLLYFPLVTDKVRRHFAQYVNQDIGNNEIWLEFNEQPIKWNHPIGLWFDLYSDGILPWSIVVHFDKYPESKICRCLGKDGIRSQFMAIIKEADALKHKGAVINSMQERDHNQLWLGFQNDKFDQFWSVNRKLMESPGGEGFKNIPMRCYTAEKFAMQRLIKPIDEETSSWVSLEDALFNFFPNFEANRMKVLIHGIEPPLKTPIQWLSEHLSYPDNFLHLVVLPIKDTTGSSNSVMS